MLIKRTISSLIVAISILFIAIFFFSTITLIMTGREAAKRVMAAFASSIEKQTRIHSEKITHFLSQQIKEKKSGEIPLIISRYMKLPGRNLENIYEIVYSRSGSILFIKNDQSFPIDSFQLRENDIKNIKNNLMEMGGGVDVFTDTGFNPPLRILVSVFPIPDTDLWYALYYDLMPIEKNLLEIFKPLIRFNSFSFVLIFIASLVFFIFIIFFSYFTIKKTDRLERNLIESNKKLTVLSSLDGLTGIANRRRFDEYLSQEVIKAETGGKSLSLLMADIDYFKKYNDTYGHQMGDLCIRRVAGVFTETCRRPTDLPARYGGEEFTVVLPDTDINGALRVAEIIREEVVRMGIPHKSSPAGPCISVSIGLTTMNTGTSISMEKIIYQADQALYRAKEEGRNRSVIYPTD